MGTFGDSWQLTKSAFRMIREDKALLLFPLVSGLAAIGIIVLFAVGLFTLTFYTNLASNVNAYDAVVGVLLLLVYFVLWIVSVFFSGALVGAAMMKLSGKQPTFGDGIRVASSRAGKLVAWALLGGTLMLLIRLIASRIRGIAGTIFGLAAGVTVGVLTYFLIPVLMYEDHSAWGSIKRSGSLFVKTFGRTFVSNLVLGLLLALGFIAAIVLGVIGAVFLFSGPLILGVILLLAAVALFIFMAILSSAAEGVLMTALYRYATTGQVAPGMIPPAYLGAVPSGANAGSGGGRPLNFGSGSWPPPPS